MKIVLVLLVAFTTSIGFADHTAITHAPIGVMGDHVHGKGEFMLSLRTMHMNMSGMRRGSSEIKDSDYSQAIKPQEMKMTMAMLGLMYGLSDKLTLMGMLNYTNQSMDLKNAMMNVDFETKSSGLADSSFTLLYKVIDSSTHHGGGILKLGLGVPTGSINEKDEIPMVGETQLPYPMQLGSGTWDPFFGFVYQNYFGKGLFNWGVETTYKFRLGDNENLYQLGDQYNLNLWLAYEVKKFFSVSARVNWFYEDVMNGSDNDLSILPAMNPTADTENSGGNKTTLFLGSNFHVLNGHRLAFEVGVPIAQNVNGIQMNDDWQVVVGWQYLL